jgi:alpha-beta hydrolase superfamily lysophospholipase
VTWPGLYHEILNEDKKDEVISQYVDWVNTEILKS